MVECNIDAYACEACATLVGMPRACRHTKLFLMLYGILCHCDIYSNDNSHE